LQKDFINTFCEIKPFIAGNLGITKPKNRSSLLGLALKPKTRVQVLTAALGVAPAGTAVHLLG